MIESKGDILMAKVNHVYFLIRLVCLANHYHMKRIINFVVQNYVRGVSKVSAIEIARFG